jgi:hypothetical protein
VDDVGTGAFQYLGQFSDVTSLLGSFPSDDPVAPNAGKPWLFTDTVGGQVLVRVEGTSACAVVVGDFGGWGVPPQLGTERFRRLRVDIWVDPVRDAANSVTGTSEETTNRGLAVFNAIQFRLQRTDPDVVFWGDLATNGCQLLTEPQFAPEPDGDWLQVGTAYYGVSFIGWSDASE